jgi:type VI secretion system protein ImpB
VQQIEPLRKLFDARQKLMDLLAKLDGNDKLDALLQEIVENPDNQKALKASTAAPAA